MSYTSDNSAYVILVNDDNTMTITQKRRIVQRSKLVDNLWFLVSPVYNGYSMAEFTVLLEYLAPVSRQYRTEFLTLDIDTYNGYLKYTLPFDTNFTAEAGDVDLTLTFLKTELDKSGKGVQRVRKVSNVKVSITPVTAWCDIIPDSALSALDQRIIKTDAQIRALDEMNSTLLNTKADDLSYNEDENAIQLVASGKEIGTRIMLKNCTESIKDGIPIVDIDKGVNTGFDDDPNLRDVVLF